ncbi:MAG: pilus assembly protein PilM, partial [Planctomycetaceae bacterium]|nr:pilus assembly protein PilM [Planctomycetaceae bacterium]
MSEQMILEWDRDQLRVLSLTGGGRHFQVLAAGTLPTAEHVDPSVSAKTVGDAIREWLNSQGIPLGDVDVVLPRDAVVVRRLQLPHAPDDELPDLVRFQAATKASTSMDHLVLDYLKIPGADAAQGLSVMTMTIDRDQLSRLTAVLSAAGLSVRTVGVSPLTVARLVELVGHAHLGEKQADVVVFQNQGRVEVTVLNHGTLVLSHALRLPVQDGVVEPQSLKSELARLMVARTQAGESNEVGRCFYVSGHTDEGVKEILHKRLGVEVESIDLSGVVTAGDVRGYESLLGAATREHGEKLHLDFLAPRKKREIPDRRKLYWGVGIALALLVASTAYLVFQSKKSALESSIEGLVDRELDLDKQLKAGEPRVLAHERLAEWNESRADTVELWTRIQQHLPTT